MNDHDALRFQIAAGARATRRAATAILLVLLAIPAGLALFALPRGPVTFEASQPRVVASSLMGTGRSGSS